MKQPFFLGLRMPTPLSLNLQNLRPGGSIDIQQGEDIRYVGPRRSLCPCCGQWFTVNPDGTPAKMPRMLTTVYNTAPRADGEWRVPGGAR